MRRSMSLYTILLTFYGAINLNIIATADNIRNEKSLEISMSEATITSNICNSHDRNVAIDLILIDNEPVEKNEKIFKNIKKRHIASDTRKEFKDRPRPDQKSLLIIFDGTGSMHDDLQQLRSGAQEIINDLSSRDDSPIFNYVLVVFRDPSVDPPFETRNPTELLEKLKHIKIAGGGDCPEMALSGLKIGLKFALSNSFAYVFSDASSKDYRYYDEVVSQIQKKQVTVNFLLTGDCKEQNSSGYKVYQKLSRVSNGQVYDMNKSNVKDVLVAIKDTVRHNYAALKFVDVEQSGISKTKLNVDKSIFELKVSIAGRNPTLSIRDPANVTIKANDELSLKNLKLVNIKGPKDGVWQFEAGADSSHSIRLSALSDLKFEFGFSLEDVEKISETAFQPLIGHKNILSLFVSDPSLINNLTNITIILVPSSPSESSMQFTIPLMKKRDNVYATKPFDVPNQMFKIQLNGIDVNGNIIERLISTGLISSHGSAPEINIEVNQKEIYEGEHLFIKCIVKSHIPVNITWSKGDKILEKIHSNQSNELELNIPNAQRENHGIYKCLAINSIQSETEEINISILTIPSLKILMDSPQMQENLNYSLKCIIDDSREQKFEITWIDDNETILQSGGEIFLLTATYLDNMRTIKCRGRSKDFVIEDAITLNVNYPPRFSIHYNHSCCYLFGSNVSFDCSTIEHPLKNSISWVFTPKDSNTSLPIGNHNDSIMEIKELLEEHEGTYKCTVSNTIGKITQEFNITLLPKESPNIFIDNDAVIVKETDNVELSCECKNCLPLLNISWTHENVKNYEKFFIKNEEKNYFKAIMKLDNVDETDNGTFYCSMWNALGEDKVSIELLVQTLPKIEGIIMNNDEFDVEMQENYEILEGKNFSVECITDGFPVPIINWIRNNETISNESLLYIENISLESEGDYECVAQNHLGTSKRNFHVEVNFPPRKKREIDSNFEILEDNNVTLICDLIGNPIPKISWQINYKELESNEKFHIENNTLHFIASVDDSGIYQCRGINKFGQSTIDFSIFVMSLPKILTPDDESIKVTTNNSLKLYCEANGYPQPNTKFTKNNQIISNGSYFEIESAEPKDSGNYNCIAENQVGMTEKIFYVTVVEKPKIISSFDNITVLNNSSRQIFCFSSGIPEPEIIWKQYDQEIIRSVNVLNLNDTFESGRILCIAENSEGTDEKEFYIEVVKFPRYLPHFDEIITEIQLRENDGVELLCPFENYDILSWTLNNSPLHDVSHKEIDNKLIIYNANEAHKGTWTCKVFNKAGESKFSYEVYILKSPVIYASWNLNDRISEFFYTESDIDEKVLEKGENLILNCTANGSPFPKVQWKKGADLIAEGEILSINNLHFHHSDIYTCSAENTQGSVKKFFKIDVVSAPYFDESIVIQTNFEKMPGDTVILKCNSIVANPAPLYFWFKDNVILDEETDDHMTIDSLKVEHEGKYRCLVKNKFGTAKKEFEISIYQAAIILAIEEEIEIIGGADSLKLGCTSLGNPLPILSWTLNGHVLSTTSKLNIEKVLKTTNDNVIYFDGYGRGISFLDPLELKIVSKKFYSKLTLLNSKTIKLEINFKDKKTLHLNKLFCYSFNGLGRDEKSFEIKIKQRPYFEQHGVQKVQDFEILEHMPLLLNCLIQGFPQPQITWYKNGQKVYENETIEFLKNNQFLRISEAFSWNSGNYSCVGKNELGDLQLKFNVLILSPPKIVKHPNANIFYSDDKSDDKKRNGNEEIVDVLRGSDVILECSIEASPKAKIHWIKLNFFDPLSDNELLKDEENFLTINAVQESCNFMCFANNTIGNIQKFFYINVLYSPIMVKNDNKIEETFSVKLHHSLNLECQTKASPEALTYWSLNSTNITKSNDGYYFSTDNQILRITNANKNHEGKYICTSINKLGWIQKIFYVNVEIPIQYSPWSEWSECSATCGSNGVQYRSRTCVLLDTIPSYNCSGDNVQIRKCNEIPCPVNGGWSEWSEWSACPKCYDAIINRKPKQKRFRKCDSPLPMYGGINCSGNEDEERECKINVCPVNGKWSEWSSWTECSKTCGKGFKSRKRLCNNPKPMYNGKFCEGENYEYEECKIKSCNNLEMRKSLSNNNVDASTEEYGEMGEFEIKNDENGNPKIFKFMQHREMEYSPPINSNNNLKVKVTLDTYKPISEETYNSHLNSLKSNAIVDTNQSDDYFDSFENIEMTEATLTASTEKNCGQGFKYNQVYKQCEEIDECKLKHACKSNEICINTIGSYRCEKSI